MSLSDYQQRSRQLFGNLGGGVSEQQRQAVRSLLRRKKEKEEYGGLLDSLARKAALDQRDKQTLQSVMNNLKLGNISVSDDEKIKALQNKIANQQTSLAATGQPDTVKDDRNAVEKFLNLHPHQNGFFDVLQVLGRPQQALYGAFDAAMSGHDISNGALQGLTGNKETSGSELLGKYAGMDKGVGRSLLGFGVDVLADPLNFVGGGLGRNLAKEAAIEGTSKGLLDKASQKIGETFYNKIPLGKELGNAFGLGKSIDLHGNYTDALNELDQSNRAIRDYQNLKTEAAIKHASDLTGGYDNGVDIGRVLQLPDVVSRSNKINNTILSKQDELQALQKSRELRPTISPQSLLSNTGEEVARLQDEINKIASSDEYLQLQKAANEEAISSKPWLWDNNSFARKKYLDQQIALKEAQLNRLAKSDQGMNYFSPPTKDVNPDITSQLTDEIKGLKNSKERKNLLQLQDKYGKLSKNPKLDQAASHIRNNVYDEILKLGKDAGIPLDEHIGYMPRVLTDEAKAAMESGAIPKISNMANTNKKVLDRELTGTVDEINKRFRPLLNGADLFEQNGLKSTAVGSRRLVNYITQSKFMKDVLQDPNLAIKVGSGVTKPANSVMVDVGQFLKKDHPLVGELKGKYYVTPGVADSFKNFMRLASDEDTLTQFASGIDKVHRLFKSTALFTGKYHLNNAAGSFMMQYLRGINPIKAVKYNTQAVNTLVHVKSAMKKGGQNLTDVEKKATQIYDEFLKQGISARGANGHFGEEFIQKEGEAALEKRLSGSSNKLNPMTWMETSRKLGENTDEAFRLGTYLAGKSSGMGSKQAAKMVRETHLDPTDLTQFERNVMRRLIPFYTFTKKSLPFLIKNGIKNPGVLTNLGKAAQAGYNATGQNENITPDYLKSSFSLPISPEGQLNLNLPINIIPQFLDDPAKFTTDQASPFLKAFTDLSGGDGVGKVVQDFLPPVQRGISGYEQGGADQSILKILGLNPVTNADQSKFTQQKLAGMSKEYTQLLKDTQAPTVTDLRQSGLVSNGQVAPNQLTQSNSFLDLAKQQGIDDASAQQLLLLKQYIESHNPETAQKWAAFLQQKGISPDLIQMITANPLQY